MVKQDNTTSLLERASAVMPADCSARAAGSARRMSSPSPRALKRISQQDL